jgi:ATP-dependent Lhr-like helicase
MSARHALEEWFSARDWQPADFQRAAWQAYASGDSGLIHAPTGAGKTLALIGGPLLAAIERPPPAGQLRVLWITPLRALASDTLNRLRELVDTVAPGLTIARRTADSDARERRQLNRKPPWCLLTTPESLSLLLSHAGSMAQFAHLDAVLIDEWHEFLGSKRGVQLELCLARLRRYAPALRCWGVSASLGNLVEAAQVLAGPSARLIEGAPSRPVEIRSLLTPDDGKAQRYPWAGHLGLRQLPAVLRAAAALAETHQGASFPSQLLFTNTRAQAELWFRALQAVWPWPAEQLALHHGSLEREHRFAVEEGLRSGGLRLVVATSSLDLGVDFPAVDEVIQIGSPRSIARLLQRAGRSAHRPGAAARLLFVATHAFELIDIAAARDALTAGVIEPRRPLIQPLDVLAQHLVTLALGGGFEPADMLSELRRTHAYRELTAALLDELLLYLRQGGRQLHAYPGFRRLECIDGRYLLRDARQARRHRGSIGTIVGEAELEVRFRNGQRLGRVEEGELAKLQPGEGFVLGGRSLTLLRLEADRAIVRAGASGPVRTPRWMGGRLLQSGELSNHIAARLTAAGLAEVVPGTLNPVTVDCAEMETIAPILALQRRDSALPSSERLLCEEIRLRDGQHLCLYPLAGRDLHEALAALLAHRIQARLRHKCQPVSSVSFAVNDHGLILSSPKPLALDQSDWAWLWQGELPLVDELAQVVNLAELARRQFRDVAQISGLAVRGLPGQRRSLRQLQVSTGLLFEVLSEHEPEHLLLAQARAEAIAQKLAPGALDALLRRMQNLPPERYQLSRLTPFAFGLWAERQRARLNPQDWKSRIEAMAERLERG